MVEARRMVMWSRSGTPSRCARAVVALSLLALGVGTTAPAETLRGTCIKVPDADTLELWMGRDGGVVTVHLAGIDADSLHQHYGKFARLLMRDRVMDRPVTVEVHGRDATGAVTGRVIVDHYDLSYLIVSEGLARPTNAAPAGMRLLVAEEQARAWARGMWAGAESQRSTRSGGGLSAIAWQVDQRRAHDPWPFQSPNADEDGFMTLGSWLGSHQSTVIASWGLPDSAEPDGRGGSVLVYDRCFSSASAAGGGCRLLLYVDRDGRVYNRAWQGP